MDNTVIKIEGLNKMYHLGTIGYGTIKDDLQSWWAHLRGKEDPNTQIGKKSRIGEHGEFWALQDINLDIKQGERVAIIGRNGAGKSTLLKILSRITAPTSGKIKIKGRVTSLLEVGTGFHGELTGRENIYLNGAILGMRRFEIARKLDEIIEFSGIEHHIDTPVKRYSSGMFVRLGFAVAAHLDSDILIADEVLAVGDAEFQKKALGKMQDLSTGQGRTVLFVSHNMASIKALCNKGVLMDKGLIKNSGNIDLIIQKYDEITKLSAKDGFNQVVDNSLRRGAGAIKFDYASMTKSEYFMDEDIVFKFSVKTSAEINGLYFSLFIKNDNGEIITSTTHILNNGVVKIDFANTYQIKIEGNFFRPGRYPLYVWVGDERALYQNVPTNYEVLDEFLPPLIIVETNTAKNSVIREHVIQGHINVKSVISLV